MDELTAKTPFSAVPAAAWSALLRTMTLSRKIDERLIRR